MRSTGSSREGRITIALTDLSKRPLPYSKPCGFDPPRIFSGRPNRSNALREMIQVAFGTSTPIMNHWVGWPPKDHSQGLEKS
jgi:hypothetical protein